ncbi:glycosyltransferase [Labedella phragmitis]|uniref:Glycosyltransferase n=1 Tax=Labedella phragmitis TaxID=2498849 RepID=A0A444PQA4_9MICO|nr:glycosyltransferase [Labedella phragmitis]RWZ46605.1 glycosyltransferase [Labedella phragmitis]
MGNLLDGTGGDVTGSLWIDTRWNGVSGIGRFSREVTSRLRPGWKSLSCGSPSSALDVVNPRRLSAGPSDLIYSPGYNGGLARAPQLLTLHDLMHLRSERSELRARYYDLVIRPIVKRCGAVLTVSEASRSVIEEWLGDGSVRVINVGNGLSRSIEAAPASTSASRRVLYVGNMKDHKKFPLVARALAGMSDWSLDVVTTDPAEAGEMIGSLPELDGRVRLLSRISDDELAGVYATASVIMMPSSEEGFGLPAIEALAADRRVVYWSGCDAIGEVLGKFGVCVSEPDDIREWQASIVLAASMTLPSEQPGYSEWLQRYDWDDVAGRVQSVLDDLGAAPRKGDAE